MSTFRGDELITLASELGHSIGDRIVEAPIESTELVDGDGSLLLGRQFGDRLTEVAVIVND